MFKLFLKSFKAGSHSGSSLFSPGKSDVSNECVTPDNTVTRLHGQGAWEKRAGRFLGLWLAWGLGLLVPPVYSAATIYTGYMAEYMCGQDPRWEENWVRVPCSFEIPPWREYEKIMRASSCLVELGPIADKKGLQALSISAHVKSGYYENWKDALPNTFLGYGYRSSLEYCKQSQGKECTAGLVADNEELKNGQYRVVVMHGWSDNREPPPGCAYSFEVYNSNGEYGYIKDIKLVTSDDTYGAADGLYILYNSEAIENPYTPNENIGTVFGGVDYADGSTVTHTFSLVNYGEARSIRVETSDYTDFTAVPIRRLSGSESLITELPGTAGIGTTDFSVAPNKLDLPTGMIGAPGQVTFDITFKPSGKGLRQAMINIDNEEGETELLFLIQGGAISPLELRGGVVYGNIGDMDDTPEEINGTDFLSQKISDTPTTHTFTLLNKETRDITAIIELRDPTTGFSLSEQSVVVPTATDEGAGSAAFDITFDPATTGIHETFVDLNYDGERQLSFKVSGEGESGGGGAVSPLGLGLLGLLLAGLGCRRYRLSKQIK
ncbi:MAG: choice-of-anchor D domain-containing protein [Thiolinea sp.]